MAETVKMVMLLGEYMNRSYHGRYYAKAQNLPRAEGRLRCRSSRARPARHADHSVPRDRDPALDCSREEYVTLALNMVGNTCPFDVSGHPAMTVPCAKVDDLPVGMMLVGRRFDEGTVLRAAAAFEALGDWQSF